VIDRRPDRLPMSTSLRHDDAVGVRLLTFDRAERLNSFTAGDYRDLHLALDACLADDAVHAVVLTGAGRAFSAGADRSLLTPSPGDPDPTGAGVEFTRLIDLLNLFDKPLFAAVNGPAVGIGATILMYCDLVVIAETAQLRFPFTALGIVPEAGSSALLPLRLPGPAATWAMLSSEWIDSATAVEMGLAWRRVPDEQVVKATREAAAAIAALDPASVRATKRLLTAGRADIANAAVEREMAAMRELFTSVKPTM
jgi:enoyl-CoA hydratase/carnithine racemase